jgi:hypothetical protein
MHKAKLPGAFFLLAVAVLFVYGVTELLVLRFERGDVYPSYSSYRADPLGTKALYEGLGLLKEVEAVRNVEPLPKLSGLSGTTLFLFGLRRSHFCAMQLSWVKALEEAALEGGRIVISFAPTDAHPIPDSKEKEKQEALREDAERQDDEKQGLHGKEYVDLADRWSVETELSGEKEAEASLGAPEEDLPSSLAWYSTLVLKPRDNAWRTIYTRAGKPVLIERSYGKGSIILSSDSFFLSNEAMKSNRYPRLLSWLCGAHRRIVFDETHLGVSRSPGVAALLRKYGLAPFFISLMALALLAIWKQCARFVPAWEEDEQPVVDARKDSFTGLTNLLRRNIPADDILNACLEEWKRSFTHGRRNRSALLPRIQEMIASDRAQSKKNRNPVRAYRQISALDTRRPIRRRFNGYDVRSTQ